MGHTFTDMSFEQLRDDVPAGTIVHDSMEPYGIRFVIVRNPYSLCAYLGIPKDHPAAGKPYDEIGIVCHYDITFAGTGQPSLELLSSDTYWYGWDYGHYCDRSFVGSFNINTKFDYYDWTVEKVIADSQKSIVSLIQIMQDAEEQASEKPPAKVLTHCTMVTFQDSRKFREDE